MLLQYVIVNSLGRGINVHDLCVWEACIDMHHHNAKLQRLNALPGSSPSSLALFVQKQFSMTFMLARRPVLTLQNVMTVNEKRSRGFSLVRKCSGFIFWCKLCTAPISCIFSIIRAWAWAFKQGDADGHYYPTMTEAVQGDEDIFVVYLRTSAAIKKSPQRLNMSESNSCKSVPRLSWSNLCRYS